MRRKPDEAEPEVLKLRAATNSSYVQKRWLSCYCVGVVCNRQVCRPLIRAKPVAVELVGIALALGGVPHCM